MLAQVPNTPWKRERERERDREIHWLSVSAQNEITNFAYPEDFAGTVHSSVFQVDGEQL